jgi:hypothetical protein
MTHKEQLHAEKRQVVGNPPFGHTNAEHRLYYAWWRNKNRDEYNKKRKEWSDGNRKRRYVQQRQSYLYKKFNITFEQEIDMLKCQNYKCAICGCSINKSNIIDNKGRSKKDYCIDHNHQTNQVCGILCHRCNSALGLLKDNALSAYNATKYLLKTRNNKEIDDKCINIDQITD